MKEQGIKLFKSIDLNSYKYPVVIVIDTDFSTDGVIGPFSTPNDLNEYIIKYNLDISLDSYSISTIVKPN